MIDKYITVDSKLWTKHRNYFYAPFPRSPIEKNELIGLDESYLFARCSYDFDIKSETDWWYIVKDGREDISAYNSKHRNQIKRGLNNFRSIPIEISVLKEFGYKIFKECIAGYGNEIDSKSLFYDSLDSDMMLGKGVQFFGIFDESHELVAYAKNLIDQDSSFVFYENIYIPIKYKKLYSNYSLIHKMNEYYLNELNVKYVSDGTRTLLHPTGIQDFLIKKFHFRKAYCRMDLRYAGVLSFLIPTIEKINKFAYGSLSNRNAKINALLEQHRVFKSTSLINE